MREEKTKEILEELELNYSSVSNKMTGHQARTVMKELEHQGRNGKISPASRINERYIRAIYEKEYSWREEIGTYSEENIGSRIELFLDSLARLVVLGRGKEE